MNDMTAGARPDGVRLQKVLAQAGVASRRAAEELIAAGRVSVDGEVVREMGRRVDPDTAVVHVDGSRIVLRDDLVHLALNKPRGMLSTMSDDRGRPCVGDLVVSAASSTSTSPVAASAAVPRRAARRRHRGPAAAHQRRRARPPADAPVVRDGEDLPRRGHRARCRATWAAGCATASSSTTARCAVHSFKLVDSHAGRSLVELVIHEGRKHVVRRLLDEVGHPGAAAGAHRDRRRPARRPAARPDPRRSPAPRSGRCTGPSGCSRAGSRRSAGAIQVDDDTREDIFEGLGRARQRGAGAATSSRPTTSSRSSSRPPPT